MTGFAEKLKKEDHDDDNDRPEDQVLIKRTQKFSSNIEYLPQQINIVCLLFQHHGFTHGHILGPLES